MDWFYYEAQRRGFNTALGQPVENALKSPAPWSSGWNMSLMHSKANFVCWMFRDLLGTEKLRGIIKRIIREKAGTVMGNAELVQYCREAFGEDLKWFVADWIDGAETLDYAVVDAQKDGKGWRVTVAQMGSGAFPVWVEAQSQSGRKLRQRVDRRSKQTTLLFEIDESLTRVRIDPEDVYPDIDRQNNVWHRRN